jgi:hypothetical protein
MNTYKDFSYLYNILPNITGFEFQYDNDSGILLRKDNQIVGTDTENKAFDDDPDDPEVRFWFASRNTAS